MTQLIGLFVGAVLATFLVSRVIMAVLRRWISGNRLVLAANGLSLIVVTVIAGIGLADGRGFVPLEGLQMYGPAQCVVLVFDFWRRSRESKTAADTGKDG